MLKYSELSNLRFVTLPTHTRTHTQSQVHKDTRCLVKWCMFYNVWNWSASIGKRGNCLRYFHNDQKINRSMSPHQDTKWFRRLIFVFSIYFGCSFHLIPHIHYIRMVSIWAIHWMTEHVSIWLIFDMFADLRTQTKKKRKWPEQRLKIEINSQLSKNPIDDICFANIIQFSIDQFPCD